MTATRTAIGELLSKIATVNESYFVPKDVKDWIGHPDNGPIAYIKPWKTHKAAWWVFTAPESEKEHYRNETGLEITHLFVSDRFTKRTMDDKLFHYNVGQFNLAKAQWRWLDPDKDYEEGKYALSNWKEGKLVNSWPDRDARIRDRVWWYS